MCRSLLVHLNRDAVERCHVNSTARKAGLWGTGSLQELPFAAAAAQQQEQQAGAQAQAARS
jgi:hypothetical protein